MRLASKESVMTWYRCREVCCLLFATCGIMTQHEKALSRFRGKIKTRLDAVACLSFCIPAGLIAALLVSTLFLTTAGFVC